MRGLLAAEMVTTELEYKVLVFTAENYPYSNSEFSKGIFDYFKNYKERNDAEV